MKDDASGFMVVGSGSPGGKGEEVPEESVAWKNEFQIEFKIILTEMNNDRRRYLVLNIKNRHIQILRSSKKEMEMLIPFSEIANVERSIEDHRQIILKRSTQQSVYKIIFSSVYKVL